MYGFKILGSGSYLPKKISSEELDIRQGYSVGKIEKSTGIKNRYFVHEGQNASDMAILAIEKALTNSNIGLDDIDCIIGASGTMEQAIPYNAAIVHSKLKPSKPIPSFDVNTTCLSFVTALDVAALYIKSGRYKNILIFSSEVASAGISWDRISDSAIFGDGAAAFVVTQSEKKNLNHSLLLETYSKGVDYCKIGGGGSTMHPSRVGIDKFMENAYFEMDGKKLYKLVSSHIEDFVSRLIESSDMKMDDLKMVIPHQTSLFSLEIIKKKLKFSDDNFLILFPEYGNQIATSIPFGIHHAISNGLIKRGDKFMILGTSAGVSLGAMILEY